MFTNKIENEIWKVTKISLNNDVKALKIVGTANASSTFRIQIIIFGINDWIIKNFENLIFDVLYDSVSEKFKLFFSVKQKSFKKRRGSNIIKNSIENQCCKCRCLH